MVDTSLFTALFGGHENNPYPLVFEALPDAMIIVDSHGVILLANEKACELFGWNKSALTGAKVERLIPARFGASHQQLRQEYHAAPRSRAMGIELELFGLRNDGTEFPVEIALSPVKIGEESVVAASIRDLTHTLRLKDAAKRTHYSSQVVRLGELALRSKNFKEWQNEIPRLVVDALHSDVVFVVWTRHGGQLRPRIVYGLSGALLAKLESASQAMYAKLLAEEQPHVITDYRHEPDVVANIAEQLQLRSGLHVPLQSKVGMLGVLAAHSRRANQFGTEELHFLQAVGIVIVESILRTEIEEQLAHTQRLESIGQLTGGIAHDFNNILTVVLGNLQMLHETMASSGDAGVVKLAESAQRAARRGADLTQKLLTFASKQALAPAAIEPAAVLGAMAEMLQRTMGKGILIECQVASDCPPCLADPAQLDNAIVNLAINARDAMPDGGTLCMNAAPVTIAAGEERFGTTGELAPGEYVALSLRDNGQGMTPEVLRRAYEPFFTTKASGKGSGLGLSMVYGFAKQSGGSVRIDSKPGGGTEVTMYFPVAGADVRPAAPHDKVRGPHTTTSGNQETILLVDDDPEVLEVAASYLANAGYRVLKAADATTARRWLHGTESISLLFTDVVLGAGETGPRLAAEALKTRPGLPVLYTSGFAHGLLEATEVRPDQFLPKPYLFEDLAARIETLLGKAPGDA